MLTDSCPRRLKGFSCFFLIDWDGLFIKSRIYITGQSVWYIYIYYTMSPGFTIETIKEPPQNCCTHLAVHCIERQLRCAARMSGQVQHAWLARDSPVEGLVMH